MYKTINKFMIPRKNMLVVPSMDWEAKNKLSPEEVSTIICNLSSLGYIPDTGLHEWLCFAEKETALETYTETMLNLQEILGVREYKPMYPNFPQQVIDASDMELLINAILHYHTNGDYMPIYETLNRHKMRSTYKPTELKATTIEGFKVLGHNLMMSKTSISEDDKAVLIQMFYGGFISSNEIPLNIEHKENKALVWELAIREFGLINTRNIENVFNTATDVLRLMTALSDGDVSLVENTKFRSFKRAERRMFMSMLNVIDYTKLVSDMDKYAERWKRVGERLHPFEFKSYLKVQRAFAAIRENEKIIKFNSVVDGLVKFGNITGAAHLLSTKPGELARKLDVLLRKSDSDDSQEIITLFKSVANNVDTPVLLQVRSHFMGRAYQGYTEDGVPSTRIFYPKGNTAKAHVIPNTLSCVSSTICEKIVSICEEALVFNYAKREQMGKVYIDTGLKKYLVPYSQRSASRALKTLVRGSHIGLGKKCKVIRTFVWWKNGAGRTDLDLSAELMDENFNYIGHVSYTNLRTDDGEAVHSGDVVDAPDGACEFIDVNIDKMLKTKCNVESKKVRYVAFNVYAFTNHKFSELPECFMGWMERNSLGQEGEIYDARTVANKIDLMGETRVNVPMVLDLATREIIWVDLSLSSKADWNNVENSAQNISLLVKGVVQASKSNIYDLIKLNTKARGTLVKSKKEADIIFGVTEGITPFDVDVLMANYI